jgi:hypothetical protein
MQPVTERATRSLAAAAAVLAAPVAVRDVAAADRLAAALTARLEAMTGEQMFAGLPAALREAELQALQISLAIYEAGLRGAEPAVVEPGQAFHVAAVQFSATSLVAAKAAGSGVRRVKPAAATGPGEANSPTRAHRRLAAEEAMLGELDLALGARRLPERFLAIFLDARPDGAAWFDAFSLYVAWHIRSDGGLQAGLAAEPLPALSAVDLDMPGLLEEVFQLAKQTALRIEGQLAEADAGPAATDERPNQEIAAYLARLPREIASAVGVPSPPLQASAAAMAAAGGDPARLEERLGDQAVRLKAVIAILATTSHLSPTEAAARQQALLKLREGRPLEALAALRPFEELAEVQLAMAGSAALVASWAVARTHLNRAVELIKPDRRAQALAAAFELAHVLSEDVAEASQSTSFEVYLTLMSATPADLDPGRRADIAVRLAASALRVTRGQRQLTMLTAAAERLATLGDDIVRRLGAVQKAKLACARGDIDVALAGQGADRLREAVTAFTEGLRQAQLAQNNRLASELHVRLGDVALLRAAKSGPGEAQALRAEALAAFQAAQTPRLRSRDPIWWVEVKVRIAEASLAIGDAAALKSGVIGVKAALRLLKADGMGERLARGLSLLGDLLAALHKAENAPRWRAHALAAYEEGLASIDRTVMAGLWSNLQVKIATLHLPDGQEDTTADLERAIACYRAALSVLKAGVPRYARIERLLADSLTTSGRRRLDLAQLDEAAQHYRAVLALLTLQSAPGHWCQAWMGLADAERERARLIHDASRLAPLARELEGAEQKVARSGQPWMVAGMAKALGDCREMLRRIEKERPVIAGVAAGDSDPARRVASLLKRA